MFRWHALAEQMLPGTKLAAVLQKLGLDCGVISGLVNLAFLAYAEVTLNRRPVADALSFAVDQIVRV